MIDVVEEELCAIGMIFIDAFLNMMMMMMMEVADKAGAESGGGATKELLSAC